MRRVACIWLGVLATVGVVGSTAGAAASSWHVTPVRDLGKGIGVPAGAAVNRSGTSIVLFSSGRWLSVVRRAAGAAKFRVSGRMSARGVIEERLRALPSDHFLLVYHTRGRRLLARDISPSGRFDEAPHVLSTDYLLNAGTYVFPEFIVDSDGSRTVLIWGTTSWSAGANLTQVSAAIDSQAGWSSSKVLYSVTDPQQDSYEVQVVHDDQDRFLLSLRGENGPPALMWGLPAGSERWGEVTPPQAADDSPLAEQIGATLGSLNGTISAAWQDASAPVVVSSWNGSSWTAPVAAIAGTSVDGHQVAVYPLFVSDGSHAAIIWAADDNGFYSRIQATIRSSAGDGWTAPLVFPHSRAAGPLVIGGDNPLDYFWFAASGALAGAWTGDPVKTSSNIHRNGLYVGQVSASATSSIALARARPDTTNHIWFALPRAGSRSTIVWVDKKKREYATTTNGAAQSTQSLPACGLAGGASNSYAASEVLLLAPSPLDGEPAAKCPTALVWSGLAH